MTILFLGIDLAKNVFALHGVDERGKPALVRPAVRRDQLLEAVAPAAVHHRHGSLLGRAPLGSALPGLRPHGAADGAQVLQRLDERVAAYDEQIRLMAQAENRARALMVMPGIGSTTASALLASIGYGHDFANGRQLAAWMDLAPSQYSSGGKNRLGRITKAGDAYLRTLFIMGARAVLAAAANKHDRLSRWATALAERHGYWKAVVAIAAKNARMAWAMLAKGEEFKPMA
nr:IS110 family transposase [Rubrivivax gelatinosus]